MQQQPFLDRINQQYFDGQLSSNQLQFLSSLDINNQEAVAFAEAVMANMKRVSLPPKDIAELVFWELGSIVPKILPNAWGGIVPPITFPNRHVLIEKYMAHNQWKSLSDGATVLDIGCGFPPLTSADMAARFPSVNFIGADPSFGKYTVSDAEGNYACILEDGSLKYMQPANISTHHWNDVFDDLESTKSKFLGMFRQLLSYLPATESPTESESFAMDGMQITRNPLRQYARANLSFMQEGIGSDALPGNLDMIRCMNVLLYFDPPFRAYALAWAAEHLKEGGLFICGLNYAQSVNCRFSVYQKHHGKMVLREFAFSLDNIRPSEIVTFYNFRSDDFEQDNLMNLVALLRGDNHFMQSFNIGFDSLLEQNKICSRKPDGYLGFIDVSAPPGELQLSMQRTTLQLGDAFGQQAASVLQSAGLKAWVNEIGFVGVGLPG